MPAVLNGNDYDVYLGDMLLTASEPGWETQQVPINGTTTLRPPWPDAIGLFTGRVNDRRPDFTIFGDKVARTGGLSSIGGTVNGGKFTESTSDSFLFEGVTGTVTWVKAVTK